LRKTVQPADSYLEKLLFFTYRTFSKNISTIQFAHAFPVYCTFVLKTNAFWRCKSK